MRSPYPQVPGALAGLLVRPVRARTARVTLAAVTLLLEICPLLESDHRMQVVFTVPHTRGLLAGARQIVAGARVSFVAAEQ